MSDDEQVYLQGVADATDEFLFRNQQFGRALEGTYPSSAAQMNALYEAGAGDAFAAVRDLARELDPPERFADEHRIWLANLDRQVAVDRLIGENARDGDAAGFLANNIRLGLAVEPYPEIDPAFGSALGPGSLGERLDPSDVEALGSYGEALFGLLRNYLNPPQTAANAFLFPGVPVEEAMAAVVETSDLLSSEFAGSVSELETMTPPEDLQPSHERLVAYFDEQGANLDALIEASAAGDGGAIFGITESMRVAYCSATSDLTGAIEPVTSIHFDPDSFECR
jgi:hypothetical protein